MTVANLARGLTPEQVAKRVRVSRRIVMSWIHAGELPATNIAASGAAQPRFRIALADVERLIASRAASPE